MSMKLRVIWYHAHSSERRDIRDRCGIKGNSEPKDDLWIRINSYASKQTFDYKSTNDWYWATMNFNSLGFYTCPLVFTRELHNGSIGSDQNVIHIGILKK